jgi:hypothetical protein
MEYHWAVLEFHFFLTIVLWLVQDDEWNERSTTSIVPTPGSSSLPGTVRLPQSSSSLDMVRERGSGSAHHVLIIDLVGGGGGQFIATRPLSPFSSLALVVVRLTLVVNPCSSLPLFWVFWQWHFPGQQS